MSKVAVITGGTKGIGRAIIEKFVSEGFDIVTCARTSDDLESMKKKIESTHHTKVNVFVANMAQQKQVKEFTDFVQQLNRPIDVLVNNTGYFAPGKITEEDDGALESMMEANLYSAYYTTRGLVAGMKAIRKGHIFNMCSVASIQAYPNGGSYAISKFALLGFSKTLREELKDFGIRVTAVLPGATRTASWDGTELPDERFIRVEDVAEAVFATYQLSPRSVVEEIIIRPQKGDI